MERARKHGRGQERTEKDRNANNGESQCQTNMSEERDEEGRTGKERNSMDGNGMERTGNGNETKRDMTGSSEAEGEAAEEEEENVLKAGLLASGSCRFGWRASLPDWRWIVIGCEL
jgi:hypothetical protein